MSEKKISELEDGSKDSMQNAAERDKWKIQKKDQAIWNAVIRYSINLLGVPDYKGKMGKF